MKKFFSNIKQITEKICIVDKFLIVFMVVLFAYIIFHMFTCASKADDDNTVYIIVRTSAASIFGYFISGNFAASESSKQNNSGVMTSVINTGSDTLPEASGIKYQIGFSDSSQEKERQVQTLVNQKNSRAGAGCSKIQITVVAVIGMVSLMILLASNVSGSQNSEISAMVSQLRDFISACIGFLISCGKTKT